MEMRLQLFYIPRRSDGVCRDECRNLEQYCEECTIVLKSLVVWTRVRDAYKNTNTDTNSNKNRDSNRGVS